MAGITGTMRSLTRISRTRFFNASRVLLFWYTVVTIFVRCPDSPGAITNDSPWMCKPYFETRETIAPYIAPYYNTYAAPYVDAHIIPYVDSYITPHVREALPYARLFQSKIYDPASHAAKRTYYTYGAPRISEAQDYMDREWDKIVKPYVDKMSMTFWAQYKENLEPHVRKVDVMIRPYLLQAQTSAARAYRQQILPAYRKASPRLHFAYARCKTFLLHVIYPRAQWALQKSAVFLSRKIWPSIRILYGQNIEPPLSKIKERLSSYRDSRRLEAAVDAIDENTINTGVETQIQSIVTSTSSVETQSSQDSMEADEPPQSSENSIEADGHTTAPSTSSSELPTAAFSSTEIVPAAATDQAPGKAVEDLSRWQAKFKTAADRGAEDLKKRVSDIIRRQVSSQVQGVGEALLVQLEENAKDALTNIKTAIIANVETMPAEASDDTKRSIVDDLHGQIRSAGKEVKEYAQNLRSWKLKFDEDIRALIATASRSTLNVIDGIRDLGLQDIGMRWASMDDITYRDWADYHELKESFDEWRGEVGKVASDHEDLAQAFKDAEEVEGRGMVVAEDTAKELARLKDVTSWKVNAGDASDNFETRQLGTAAARLGKKLLDKLGLSASNPEPSSGAMESLISQASASVSSAGSDMTSSSESQAQSIFEDIPKRFPSIDDLAETAPAVVSSISNIVPESVGSLSSVIADTATSFVQSAESLTAEASDLAEAASEGYASHLVKPIMSLASRASSSADSALAYAAAQVSETSSSLLTDMDDNSSAATDVIGEYVTPPISSASSLFSSATDEYPTLTSSILSGGSSLGDTMLESVPAAASSFTSNLAESASMVSSSLLSSVADGSRTFAQTVAPTMVDVLSTQGGDFINYAESVSESIKSRVQNAADEEEVGMLTASLASSQTISP